MINPLLYDDTLSKYFKIPDMARSSIDSCISKTTDLWMFIIGRRRKKQPGSNMEMTEMDPCNAPVCSLAENCETVIDNRTALD